MNSPVNLLTEPRLHDELQQRTEECFRHIHALIDRQRALEDSLFTGNLGLVVYHYCISLLKDQYIHNRAFALELIEQLVNDLSTPGSTLNSYQYSGGLAGLGAVLQFLVDEKAIDADMDDDFQVIDESIFEHALDQINKGYVEYMHGGAGALLYFNMRNPNEIITHYKEQLVTAILNQVKEDPLGIRIPRGQYVWTKNDDYDLSLSHGLCGVMLILLSVLEKGGIKNAGQINSYLQAATTFMVNLKREIKNETGNYSFFPSYLPVKSTIDEINRLAHWPDSRLAWCYGDLGWVIYFYRFGEYTNNEELLKLAEATGIATTYRKTLEETYSSTSHFCHGHSGLAAVYKHLYMISRRPEYKAACDYWLHNTICALNDELPTGFYKPKNLETSLLEGLAGVNLVLSSFLTDRDLKWQKFMLLS
ncbi:lanthionine synthetase LanC family protein [Longitalea luteola]|uniref:lanthionine synthetase LanC family protein n=1 Tax=Longitalea luteola TaxID=2812563 RepID=UPI001A975298|nr:lanthionine synthetase LanC family protein [Longitalea luteola]